MAAKNKIFEEWLEAPQGPLVFPMDLLQELLEQTELIEEHDTFLCDYIRLLKWGQKILIQEMDWKKQGVLHHMEDIQTAKTKINDRLTIYERMWDGCGCKVDHLT